MFSSVFGQNRSLNKQVISKIYYISKLLVELGLSNSKPKTDSKPIHSTEEIIPANISCC